MRFPWLVLCLAVASATPSKSHQLRLPFVSSPNDLETGVKSLLSIDWSIKDGSLYANNDQVYPPSTTMQLTAPLYRASHPTQSEKSVELTYSIHSRPLPESNVGLVAGIVRVRVELHDLHGNLVSPDATVVDLVSFQDGSHQITRVSVRPARGGYQADHFAQKSGPWAVKYWKTHVGSFFDAKESTSIAENDYQPTESQPTESQSTESQDHIEIKDVSVDSDVNSNTESKSPLSISSFWAAPTQPNDPSDHRHPHHHRPKNAFMRIVPTIMLPAVLGAFAGLAACLLGFFIGYLFMSFATHFGWQTSPRYSQDVLLEEGTHSEKLPMVPWLHLTVPESDV
ncbi:hypothetical protein N7522_001847 [Penicillium canescens]|uniref:Uncharacterized protein n=1 Tax=Penicillium canescens TaxID=5083 RepID=A0AAD6IBA8_PENCN|nr:uncharacterized protein N7446_012672 [Penicillium canescens]KAJ6018383.1 hypothetical protein N7522_001847 [Penicillium canescens]KAJ6038860.1 hypothetical protein N7460_007577 [Penicillium canescens]KAJ6045808.1 hypothetical protein N7446_012672 [Penicillium canescens]KAJ6066394.1 hypothetical protein N7444_000147 [Penicillium canescens]